MNKRHMQRRRGCKARTVAAHWGATSIYRRRGRSGRSISSGSDSPLLAARLFIVWMVPTGKAIEESVDLAYEIFNRMFRRVPDKLS